MSVKKVCLLNRDMIVSTWEDLSCVITSAVVVFRGEPPVWGGESGADIDGTEGDIYPTAGSRCLHPILQVGRRVSQGLIRNQKSQSELFIFNPVNYVHKTLTNNNGSGAPPPPRPIRLPTWKPQ